MAITKIKDLVARIDCPSCLSLIQWTDVSDVQVSNGNKYIVCPECGQHIMLNRIEDYWIEEPDDTPTPVVDSKIMVVDFIQATGSDYTLEDPFSTYFDFVKDGGMIFGKNDISPNKDQSRIDLYPLVYIGVNNDDIEDGTYKMLFRLQNIEIEFTAATLDDIPGPIANNTGQ